ncbi:MAG: 4,5-DOPA dioxygenase extradiol [Clostridiales bacterium]|nr:4,5-DOPA dioxygenase extradiol [Clostridiales bacterium]
MPGSAVRMPLLFVGHGSPMNALEANIYTRTWAALAARMPRPRAILCLSAHFAGEDSRVVAADSPRTIHDFYGFPRALHEASYPAPGSPELARRVQALLPQARPTQDWGLDHGAWSVLMRMYPAADIPVVQLSLELSLTGAQQMALGTQLRPLREEGVLILGSGNVVHNLRLINGAATVPYPWAQAFDTAVHDAVMAGDSKTLANYMALPGAGLAVPTTEHFVPLLYVLGATHPDEKAEAFNRAYVLGSLSMTGYLIGA